MSGRHYSGSKSQSAQKADLAFVRVLCFVITLAGFLGVATSRSTETAVVVSLIALIFLTGAVFPRTVAPVLAKATAVIATLAMVWEPPGSVSFHAENLVIALPMWGLAALLHFPSVWRFAVRLLSPRPAKISDTSLRVSD